MALDVQKSSMLQDVFSMGANLGTYYAIQKKHNFNEDKFKDIVTEKNLKQDFLKNLVLIILKSIFTEFLKNIPLPNNLTQEELINYLIKLTLKEFKKEMPAIKQNLKKNTFLELLELFFQIPIILETKDDITIQKTVPKLFTKFKQKYEKMMEENIQAAINTRKDLHRLFLQSDFPSEFITTTSKMCNVLITYYYYITSETVRFLDESKRIVQQGKDLDDGEWEKFFKIDMKRVLDLQYELHKLLIELLLFIEIWHSPSLEFLFKPIEEKTYTSSKLKKSYFEKQLQKLDRTANELHIIVLETLYKEKAEIPFTLEKNSEITEKERQFLGNLLFG